MWKTRFEVSSSQNARRSPRVRDDSRNGLVVRPTPSSSTPNLSTLAEEDEETEQTHFSTPNPTKSNAYQPMSKHSVVLPTIVESHDQEFFLDSLSSNNHQSESVLTSPRNVINIERAFTIDQRIHELLHKQSARRDERVGAMRLTFVPSNRRRATISSS